MKLPECTLFKHPLRDKTAVRSLIARLKAERDPGVRSTTIIAIGQIGPCGEEAIPALVDIVTDPSSYFGNSREGSLPGFLATSSLVKMGPKSVTALADVFSNPKNLKMGRISAGEGLFLLGRKAGSAVRVISGVFKDLDPDIRELGVSVLGAIGSNAKGEMPRLVDLLKDQSPLVRARSAVALYQIDSKNKFSLPALLHILKDKDVEARWQAVTGLSSLGSDAKGAVANLTPLIWDKNLRVRVAAIRTLGDIGPGAVEALAALETVAATDADLDVRDWALDSIRKIERGK